MDVVKNVEIMEINKWKGSQKERSFSTSCRGKQLDSLPRVAIPNMVTCGKTSINFPRGDFVQQERILQTVSSIFKLLENQQIVFR